MSVITRLFFLVAILLTACTSEQAGVSVSEDTETIRMTAEFKDPQDNRVVIFSFVEGVSAQEIKDHTGMLRHTEERLLAAYYFAEGSSSIAPRKLAGAGNIMRANDSMYHEDGIDAWHYAYMRPFVGEPTFYDCIEEPAGVLCRKQ